MELTQQVCSLELAKKLKELGVKQESLFVHMKGQGGKGIYLVNAGIKAMMNNPYIEWCAAFTVAELGEMLPPYCKTHRNFSRYEVSFPDKTWEDGEAEFYDKNEADARAKMLIHLIEHNLYGKT